MTSFSTLSLRDDLPDLLACCLRTAASSSPTSNCGTGTTPPTRKKGSCMSDVPPLVIALALTLLLCLVAGAVVWLTERYDIGGLSPTCEHGIPAHQCTDCRPTGEARGCERR